MTSFLLFTSTLLLVMPSSVKEETRLDPKIASYVHERIAEESDIPKERREELLKLTRYIEKRRESGMPVKLLFVCTHNSRRSHLAQLWAKIGAVHFGIDQLETYSGGTETTAMNPRTVSALQRVGLEITPENRESTNPKYSVAFSRSLSPEICFSKTITEAPNPKENFAAIMTCSSADASCPNVQGCEFRLALPYEDPKKSDGTAQEGATYDSKSREIAREMIFVMSHVTKTSR